MVRTTIIVLLSKARVNVRKIVVYTQTHTIRKRDKYSRNVSERKSLVESSFGLPSPFRDDDNVGCWRITKELRGRTFYMCFSFGNNGNCFTSAARIVGGFFYTTSALRPWMEIRDHGEARLT